MAIQTTRFFYPCGCIVLYTWDDTVTDSAHTYLSHESVCSTHSPAPVGQARYDCVVDEQRRMNWSLQLALDNGPTSLFDTQTTGTSTVRILKQTITVNYSWAGTAPNRTLTISFTGITLTTTQKNTIQTAVNNRFGTGKVTIA